MGEAPTTVGILYPGEMGSALGRILRGDGRRVVTTLEGRGPRSRRGCEEAGLEVLDSLAAVGRAADVSLSVVPPTVALPVAESYARCVGREGAGRLYVDLNSIAPETAQGIAAALAPTGADFVDGSVHGLASRLPGAGAVYLSGPAAGRAAGLLGRSLRVTVLGASPGTASAFKMLIAGLNKGVVALFLEMSLAARTAGLLDEFLGCCRHSYPGVLDIVERTLPTYPRHASRRGDELDELEQMLRSLDLRPCVVGGARDLLTEMGRLNLGERQPDGERPGWDVRAVIEAAGAAGMLRRTGERCPGPDGAASS